MRKMQTALGSSGIKVLIIILLVLCGAAVLKMKHGVKEKKYKAEKMIGKPALDFNLELLDGGTLALGEHLGKEVVILDFWATWCPPCVMALPIIAEVAREYKDKGVVFYAVNLMEKPDKIEDFLKEKEIDCSVALDKDGTIAKVYDVEGIPQTVIIGKDGIVRVVHVGFMSGLKERLMKELDGLLAEKN